MTPGTDRACPTVKRAKARVRKGLPVISDDNKKKELVGEYQGIKKGGNSGKLGVNRWRWALMISLLICAHGGGSNRYRSRLWKTELSKLVTATNLMATPTRTGLTLKAALGRNPYPRGITVTYEELAAVKIHVPRFHGEWNYDIKPKPPNSRHVTPLALSL